MDNSSITSSKRKNKHFNNTLFPIISGVILVVCLVFFFYTLSDIAKSKSEPEVFDIKAVSSTDTSLLLSWNCTCEAEKYSVQCIDSSGNNIARQSTDVPFAVFRNLSPNSEYTVEVSAFKDGTEYPPCSASVATGEYCVVTSVNTVQITSRSVTISWEYTGSDNGFTAVAYVIDINGKRHLTSEKVEISKGKNNECTITGLMPNINYTVAVMPNTKFKQTCKANFTTENETISHDKLTVVRAVICPTDTDYSHVVSNLHSINPSAEYKISMVIWGDTTKDETSDMSLYIKDKNGNLVSETNFGAIKTNPYGFHSYIHRVVLLTFTSPSNTGEYEACITIDGEIASTMKFETV